jgi:serine palmitoyltransferase
MGLRRVLEFWRAHLHSWVHQNSDGPLDERDFYLNWLFWVEVAACAVITYVLFSRPYKPKKKQEALSPEEVERRVKSWKPRPLVPEGAEPCSESVITTASGPTVTLEGDDTLYVNFVSHNFLGLLGSKDVHDECRRVIERYGVGSCGPRGFYGSIDVHIRCEEEIARFMGTSHAILYSYDVATPSSVVPAFAKNGDFILADEGVNLSIKTGLYLSKANVVFFKHNDVADLESKLKDEEARFQQSKGVLNRRFIVAEGVYQNFGDVAPLAAIVKLKDAFKYRLIIDESMSVGTLGKTGRGLTEHAGVAITEVDIICASMSNAVASVGGFCVGNHEIVQHQRLSSSAYCYSASLPPYISQASTTALQVRRQTSPRHYPAHPPSVGVGEKEGGRTVSVCVCNH